MIRSSFRYPPLTQGGSDKFLGMKRISQALMRTVAAARQAHPERRQDALPEPAAVRPGYTCAAQGPLKKPARAPAMPGPLNLDARLWRASWGRRKSTIC